MTSESLSLLRPVSIVVDVAPESAPEESPSGGEQAASTKRKMPSLTKPKLKLNRGGRSRKGSTLVGLDIQPGYASAVQARVNGSILVQQAAGSSLPPDTVREGEVLDVDALSNVLREMFRDSGLDKHVRVGVANQRTVLRTLELPPLTDHKELATAVRFQAEDQIPMPLENAVLDFQPLGVIDTPAGPRQRVIVVAAQRDMVERLLTAVRQAGLRPDGVDLSAFALIRSLHHVGGDDSGRVLYLNIGGLTNMAIAEGTVCRFTRVVGGGLESMATEIAERHGIPLLDARTLLADADLNESPSGPPPLGPEPHEETEGHASDDSSSPREEARIDVRPVLEGAIREITGEVRNSLDFHRSQGGGGEVSSVVLSGPALQIPGFADTVQSELGVPVQAETVGLLDASANGAVSAEHLAIAAGLAAEEAPR